MYRHYLHNASAVHFTHFINKGYAMFASMHREVIIGHVSADIANQQLLKSGQMDLVDNGIVNDITSMAECDMMNDIAELQQLDQMANIINSDVNFYPAAFGSSVFPYLHN